MYRAIDRNGNLVDVLFSEHRDMATAQAFFRSAKALTSITPDRVTTKTATTATSVRSALSWASVCGTVATSSHCWIQEGWCA